MPSREQQNRQNLAESEIDAQIDTSEAVSAALNLVAATRRYRAALHAMTVETTRLVERPRRAA